MSGFPSSPHLAPPADGPSRGWPRLSAFERVQILIIAWIFLSEIVRGEFGLQILPEHVQRGNATPLSPAGMMLRIVTATVYPLVAVLVSRWFPLWHRSRRHVAIFLAVVAALHALSHVGGVLVVTPLSWVFYLHRTFEFVVFTVFGHGMQYGERYHEKERAELRLRAEMAGSTADRMRAQVRALKMEWSPRFLTGTLESIGGLLSRDVAAAKRLLLALSSVLRRTLAHARTETLRLEQEVEFVREVLRVESLRRPELTVEWALDEAALDMPVPHMSLLTMIYQAWGEHDAESTPRIRISADADPSAVRLRVEVDGVPAHSAADVGREWKAAYGAGSESRRVALDGGGVRLELRCEAEPPARETGDRPVLPAPTAPARRSPPPPVPADGVPAIGRRLELGTYAGFALFYSLLTMYMANVRVRAEWVETSAPTWVYVCGMGAYAALWWGSMALGARWLSHRFPFRHGNWPKRLLLHLGGMLLIAVLNGFAYFPFQRFVVRGGELYIGFRSWWEWGDLAVYPPLAGIAHGFIYAREYHAKRLLELRLRSELSENEVSRTGAELQALKAELNPHFLFNALNTVSSLMHTRVDDARRVVAHLSALLRRVLESGSLQEVTVAEEVEFIRLYMEIEQARFGDALRIEYRIDPATLHARVPHLLVQPLVENAVKHGLRPREGTGHVVLSTRRAGEWLELAVVDDGVGPALAASAEGTGTGLANVRERLRQTYGGDYAFELAAAPGGGARAWIRIPFSEQPSPAAAGAPARELQAV